MDEMDPRLVEVFFDVQRGLPRQGPGCTQSTLDALKLCWELPERPDVIDIGCGPGAQTMALVSTYPGQFLAVDTCDEYLDQLRQRLQEAGCRDRVEVKHADMSKLGISEASFDLIWCEGAAYNMGIPAALNAWQPLLRDRGYLAFTELVWLEVNPDPEVKVFFDNEYPAMSNSQGIQDIIRQANYELIGNFTLPDAAWWDDYYTPLECKLPALRQKYRGDEEALAIIAMTATEIEMRRRFGKSYGYEFFVIKKVV